MTLCIAAVCQDKGKSKFVIASDFKEENSIAGAEIQNKLFWIDEYWPCLMAGTLSRALELALTYRRYFEQFVERKGVLLKSTILDHAKRPPLIQKRKLVDEYLRRTFGFGYTYFLEHGKAQLPEAICIEILNSIRRIRLDCQLIITTYMQDTPYLIKVEDDASIEVCDNFAAIGSGSDVAEPMLYRREHTADDHLSKSVYHVFEAMKYGTIAPGVGDDFAISILSVKRGVDGIVLEPISDKGLAYLGRQFSKRGPKPFSNFSFDQKRYLEKAE